MRRTNINIASLVFIMTLAAAAQESRSEIGLQGSGLFTQDATGQDVTRHATDTGGFSVSYRYHINRWLSADATYGYGRNTQEFSKSSVLYREQANLHQVTGGFVASLPARARWKLSPYVLAEGGTLTFDPTGNSYGNVTGAVRQARGVFVYGGGVNYPIAKHLSLRAEYRGLVYRAPDFKLSGLETNTITHTAQPSAGIVFRF